MARQLLLCRRHFVFTVILMLAFWGDVAQANEIQLAAIEQRAIAFRQSINSGDVQITSKVDFQDGNIRERT